MCGCAGVRAGVHTCLHVCVRVHGKLIPMEAIANLTNHGIYDSYLTIQNGTLYVQDLAVFECDANDFILYHGV